MVDGWVLVPCAVSCLSLREKGGRADDVDEAMGR
jgi:hypothetical protein